MKTTQSSGTRPVHQTVAGEFEVKTGGKSILIGFTDQRLSPQAGSATFWSWLRPLGWNKLMAGALPQALPLSNNKLLPVEKALAFMHGLLCDARRLPQVAVCAVTLPADDHAFAAGGVALRQRTDGRRERDQGTPVGVCPADVVPGKVLGDGSGVESGHADLQPDGALSTASGLAAKGDHPLAALLAVRDGVLSYAQGKTTIKLAVPHREHAWWRRLWEKILSPFPNGNAVENRPAFTS